MPGERDGGIWALGGYLYQTIGLLGISASISNLRGNDPLDAGTDLDVLIQLVDVNHSDALRIRSEAFNEDALIRYGIGSTDEGVFIQFKYSAQVPPPPIGPAEVQEIMDTFDTSVRRAQDAGLNITACVLITNRRFAQGNGSGGQLWQDEKNNPKRTYQLREIVDISPENFKSELRKFAMRRGSTESEFEVGISRLIGQVVRQVVEGSLDANTFTETLTWAFTDYRYTRLISIPDLRDACRQQLDEFARNLRVDAWNYSPIQRDIFRELFDLIQQRSLLGLCGHGGCGKSVLLWHLLVCGQHSVYTIEAATNIGTSWISRLINHTYRGIPPEMERCFEPFDVALKRVLNANPNAPRPVLWLGLDGLDEVRNLDQRNMLREIVSWFWEQDKKGAPSDAVLITTFRSSDQLDNLLGLSHDYSGQPPKIITVDQFNENELKQALQRVFPDMLGAEPVPFFEKGSGLSRVPLDDTENHGLLYRIEPTLRDSLHHPVVWRSLLNITDPERRKAVLAGEQAALAQLALGVIRWFEDKLVRGQVLELRGERLLELLSTIARGTALGSWCSNSDWLTPTHEVCDSTSLAWGLLQEAELSGLIEFGSDKTWRWKHAFVYSFLTSREG